MRYAARVDENQGEIVNAMRANGAYVYVIGLPVDLHVGHAGKTALVEIKRDGMAKYTQLQAGFMANWRGGTVSRIDSIDAALRLLRVMEAG